MTFALVGGGGAGRGAGGGTGGGIVYGTVPINGANPITWTLGLGSSGTGGGPSTLVYTSPSGFELVTAIGGVDSSTSVGASALPQPVPPGLSYIMLGGGGGARVIISSEIIDQGAAGTSLGPHLEDASPGSITGSFTLTSGNGAGEPLLPAELLSLLPVNPPMGGLGISKTESVNTTVTGGGGAGLGNGGNGGYSLNNVSVQASTSGVYGGGGAGSEVPPFVVSGGDGAFVYVIS